jgi:hypothetical protein
VISADWVVDRLVKAETESPGTAQKIADELSLCKSDETMFETFQMYVDRKKMEFERGIKERNWMHDIGLTVDADAKNNEVLTKFISSEGIVGELRDYRRYIESLKTY